MRVFKNNANLKVTLVFVRGLTYPISSFGDCEQLITSLVDRGQYCIRSIEWERTSTIDTFGCG
jgi:hypothetical protein